MNGIEILLTAICINSTCENSVPISQYFADVTSQNTVDANLKSERFKGLKMKINFI